jgi:hypothetical protein
MLLFGDDTLDKDRFRAIRSAEDLVCEGARVGILGVFASEGDASK